MAQRLNSWKEIAAYVQRDVRTVARWEKDRGLPVRRVPGSRGQVFAFTDEIDRWLTSAAGTDATASPAEAPHPAGPAAPPFRRWKAAAAAVVGIAAFAGLIVVQPSLVIPDEPIIAIDVDHHEVIARTRKGEAWRYAFPTEVRLGGPQIERVAFQDVDGDRRPDVLAVLGQPTTGPDDDVLYCFSSRGTLLWKRRVESAVTFAEGRFNSPWSSGPLHVYHPNGQTRVVWATHHHTWWPSIVARFDGAGTLTGQFVHAGWVTEARGLADGRLLIAGISNRDDADFVAALDDASWNGAGPPRDGPYQCKDCPQGRPVRYFVLPRSELSRVSASTRQRPQIHVFADTIEVHIVQAVGGLAAIIYEFSRDFELQRIRPSDAYWEWHRQLEQAGLVAHPAAECPEHTSATARRWERNGEWSEVRVAGDRALE